MTFKRICRDIRDQAGQVAAFWTDRESIDLHIKEQFDKTKVVSDFVGMIVRFGFGLAASNYFGRRVVEEAGGFRAYIFGFCWVTCLGLTLVLGSGIAKIIFGYEMRAVGDSKRTSTRWYFTVLGVIGFLCLWYGLTELAGAIGGTFATASKK